MMHNSRTRFAVYEVLTDFTAHGRPISECRRGDLLVIDRAAWPKEGQLVFVGRSKSPTDGRLAVFGIAPFTSRPTLFPLDGERRFPEFAGMAFEPAAIHGPVCRHIRGRRRGRAGRAVFPRAGARLEFVGFTWNPDCPEPWAA